MNFRELYDRQPPEVRAEADRLAADLIAEMALSELRSARELSQAQLAKALGVSQPAVAKIERQTDMYLGTLRNVIAAMGGSLELIARFPEGDVRIKQLADPVEPGKTRRPRRNTRRPA